MWTVLRWTSYAAALAVAAALVVFGLARSHDAMVSHSEGAPGQVTREGVLSPDGTQLALMRNDGSVEVRAVGGGTLGRVRGHGARVVSAVFTPDSQALVTMDADGVARRTRLAQLSLQEAAHMAATAETTKAIVWDEFLSTPAQMAATLEWASVPGADARQTMDPGIRAPLLPDGVTPPPGTMFRDCPMCPDMVVVPAGTFLMGSPETEEGRHDDEGPQHEVEIEAAFAVGRFEVTWEEWDACALAGGCRADGVEQAGGDEGWGRGRRPVMHVSWNDAKDYLNWLSIETGQSYRLLSEAELEYVARAGTVTPYPWGEEASPEFANYGADECCRGEAAGHDAWADETAPVGSFPANAFGLYDLHGNVFEWTEDCWNNNYSGAPSDGSAWIDGDCSLRVLRGGSWGISPQGLRSAYRVGDDPTLRISDFGFRVARTL